MKYSELILPAEPIATVKQIRTSASFDAARVDVETYVISERMATQLAEVIFPNLRFDHPGDQKGILVVATYGTGKTHLMSVVGGVAEYAELAERLTNPDVAAAATGVAGRFNVVRFDIGAAVLGLRDIVCIELRKGLATMGVDFEFPDWATVTNTKDALSDMMARFEQTYPDKGLLFVLDEMLDYLRGRKDAELIQDLAFLREVGEVCANTRFRFIAGVQEAIFDNPRFAGVAESVQRVRHRFEQVRIAKEDVAFVVEQRLLKKDATQRSRIAEHLRAFAPLYAGMAERMDQFVSLFPIHPDYLRTFSELRMIEKREVLRTVQQGVESLREQDVPDDSPGLVCADSYRARLSDDPSVRTIPEVKAVLDRSETLRSKVTSALPEKQYLHTALRIIDGLTVHRLTTEDIDLPVGMTPEMLRDELCLLPPGLPERDSLFLKASVSTIVSKMLTAVSGQFISIDPDNGQVYLDVRKDIDYDAQIDERADSLDDAELDKAYYLAMERVLEVRDDPYVAGYKIWEYHLPWALTNADRTGYLFMGAPNERSTAQPPRDFYIYFIQPYEEPPFSDEERADEVFIRLAHPGEEFTKALRRYAGATAKAKESTATHRPVYEDKAQRALQDMITWLKANMATAMAVTYKGIKRPLGECLTTVPGDRTRVVEQINTVTSAALEPHFAARYPGYPRFARRVTASSLETDVRVALTQIATGRPTQAGTAFLEALELVGLAGTDLRADGTYASSLVAAIGAAAGKLLNRGELLSALDPGVEVWGPWHLEPTWLMVVAAALCQQGKAELGLAGQRIDALSLDQLPKYGKDQLTTFDYIAPPKTLPVLRLREVAILLELPPGAVADTGATDTLVRELQTRVTDQLRRTETAIRALADGVELWGEQLFDLIEERAGRLDALRDLLRDLQARNSIGRLNSLTIDPESLSVAKAGKAELGHVEEVVAARDRLAPVADYLREANGVFGAGVEPVKDALVLRSDILDTLKTDAPIDPAKVVELRNAGEHLRQQVADLASRSYRHDNLDATGDRRKRDLLEGPIDTLRSLQAVTILAPGPFAQLESELADIRTITHIDEPALKDSVKLGDRYPRPIEGPSAAARLEECERRAADLLYAWVATLADSLGEAEITEQIGYVADEKARGDLEHLAGSRSLPTEIAPSFVDALNQVFKRVDIHNLTAPEVLEALFPDTSPATADQLRQRLDKLIERETGRTPPEQVRFLPVIDRP